MKHINFLTKQENWTKGIIKKIRSYMIGKKMTSRALATRAKKPYYQLFERSFKIGRIFILKRSR